MKSTFLHGHVIAIIAAGLLFTTLFAPVAGGHEIVGWGDQKLPNVPLTNLTKIAAGGDHSLALKSDGSIVGWGWNGNGQATPPAGNNFIAIAAGGSHSLALKSDGSIVGWGNNYEGQATPPSGNDFIAFAAGGFHSLALKSDGSIVGWGDNYYGQATPPSGNNFTAVAAGSSCSLALKFVCQFVLAGDLNDDCKVDLEDFAITANNWLVDCRENPSNPACVPK